MEPTLRIGASIVIGLRAAGRESGLNHRQVNRMNPAKPLNQIVDIVAIFSESII
jgi:hypothetical protein